MYDCVYVVVVEWLFEVDLCFDFVYVGDVVCF